MSREEARKRSEKTLSSIPFVPRPQRFDELGGKAADGRAKKGGDAPTHKGGLPPQELRWLAHFTREPWLLKPDRMRLTGLNKDADDDMRAKFEARGCVAFDSKVGAKWRVYRLRPRGVELAKSLGLSVGLPRGGSTGHECIVTYMQRSLKEYFSQEPREEVVRFQRVGAATTAGVQPDLLVLRASGSRFACQACHRNQPSYEADALLKLHALTSLGPGHADALDLVLAVTVNKTHRKAIEKAVKELNDGIMPHKVFVTDFDTALEGDWGEVFED